MYNSANTNIEDTLKLRVDRQSEVDSCVNTLINTNLNIYIYGERGIGKTFLLKAIYKDIVEKDSSVFPVFVNLFSITRLVDVDSYEYFYSLITLSVLSAIWEEIYENPYSTLVNHKEEYNKSGNDAETEGKLTYIYELYKQIQMNIIKTKYGKGNRINSLIEGDNSNIQHELEFKKLLSFEIIKLLEEVRFFLHEKEGKRKIIILVDEANLMSKEWQEEIITKHMDIFTNLNLQFIFVAGYLMNFTSVDVPDCFEYILNLKGLPNTYINELLIKYFSKYLIKINDDIINHIYKKCNGNPRVILGLVNDILISNYREGSDYSLLFSKKNVDSQLKKIADMRKQDLKKLDNYKY